MGAAIVANNAVLLALDLQLDFLQAKGRLPIGQDQATQVIAAMNAGIRLASKVGVKVIFVRNAFDLFDPSNLFRNFAAVRGSPGYQLDPRVAVPPGARQLEKKVPSAFSNPQLAELLTSLQIGRIVLGGVFADACVLATGEEALARGYRLAVIPTGVGAANDGNQQRALRRLVKGGATLEAVGPAIFRRG